MQGKGRQTMSVDDAARELGISRASTYNAIRRGEIPAIQIGKRVLVLRTGLSRLLRGELSASKPEVVDAA